MLGEIFNYFHRLTESHVFCSDCRHYHGRGCRHPNNVIQQLKNTPEEQIVHETLRQDNKELNKYNNCPWWHYKWPETPGG